MFVCNFVCVRVLLRGKRGTFSTLQLRAVGVNTMTFCLYSLSTVRISIHHQGSNYFITLKIRLAICEEGREDKCRIVLQQFRFHLC